MRISDWSSDVCSSDLNANSSAHSGLCFSNTSRITSPISCGRFRVVLLESVMGLLLFFRFLSLHQGPESLRSEEHTSELQSLMRISYAVFCLKKKNKSRNQHISQHTTKHTSILTQTQF